MPEGSAASTTSSRPSSCHGLRSIGAGIALTAVAATFSVTVLDLRSISSWYEEQGSFDQRSSALTSLETSPPEATAQEGPDDFYEPKEDPSVECDFSTMQRGERACWPFNINRPPAVSDRELRAETKAMRVLVKSRGQLKDGRTMEQGKLLANNEIEHEFFWAQQAARHPEVKRDLVVNIEAWMDNHLNGTMGASRRENALVDVVAAIDSWASSPSAGLYNIKDLPCHPKPQETLEAVGHRRAFFFGLSNEGTMRMRGEMMAAALSTLPGWSASCCGSHPLQQVSRAMWPKRGKAAPRDSSKLGNQTLIGAQNGIASGDQPRILCIFVKFGDRRVEELCRSLGAIIFWDLLDNTKTARRILHREWPQVPTFADFILTPTETMAWLIDDLIHKGRYERRPQGRLRMRTGVLYHHQANPGVQGPPESILRKDICRVAILIGSAKTGLDLPTKNAVKELVCAVDGIRHFTYMRPVRDMDSKLELRVDDYPCDLQMKHPDPSCVTLRPEGKSNTWSMENLSGPAVCFREQWKHHLHKFLKVVDVALQLPPEPHVLHGWNQSAMLNRPTTRFLYWLSRGVPTVFSPYLGYMELAAKFGYRLPNGQLPYFPTLEGLPAVLRLVVAPEVRAYLREQGYRVAQSLTIMDVAKTVAGHYEEVMAARRACPLCKDLPQSAVSKEDAGKEEGSGGAEQVNSEGGGEQGGGEEGGDE